MATVMTNKELANRLKDVATNHKTRYCNNHSYNKQADRTKMIKEAAAELELIDKECN